MILHVYVCVDTHTHAKTYIKHLPLKGIWRLYVRKITKLTLNNIKIRRVDGEILHSPGWGWLKVITIVNSSEIDLGQ